MDHRFTLKQIVRLFVIFVLGVFITLYAPTFEFVSSASLSNSTIVVILFVFLAGFLINQAIQRNTALSEAISIELSRLRRIVHLTENLEGRAAWKKEIRTAIVAYLETVAAKDFRDYEEAHTAFRGITHEIYAFKPKGKREELLFNELLEISRELAYQRQRVSSLIHSPISVYTKVAATFVAVIGIISLLGARTERESIFFIAGPVASILLILDIFFNLDILTASDRKRLEHRYKYNALDMKNE